MKHSFGRSWEVYEERAFSHITPNFYDVFPAFLRTVKYYQNTSNDELSRELLIHATVNDLEGRLETLDMAEMFLRSISDSLHANRQIIKFKQTPNRRYDDSYVTFEVLHMITHLVLEKVTICKEVE